MSLVGRLEDLPVSDILRIVYLSRGTGALEVSRGSECHRVLFRRGLIVNVTAPADPSLRSHLERQMSLAPLGQLGQEVPIGVAALEMNLISPADLAKVVFKRVSDLVKALCELRNGEFRFLASEPTASEIEYQPKMLFRHGGIQLEKILGKSSMQLRALSSIKESIAAGKAATSSEKIAAAPAPIFKGSVVMFEQNQQASEAIRQAVIRAGIEPIACSAMDAKEKVVALLAEKRFFVAALDVGTASAQQVSWPLLDLIKDKNPEIPAIVIDQESSFRRRHIALQAGADLYLTKPQPPKSKPNLYDEELALFAEDVALFARRTLQKSEEAKPAARDEAVADKERMYRGFRLLMQLISEVSDPSDISQLALTILQLAADYVDRGVLFAVTPSEFATLGRFGLNNSGPRGLRVSRGEMEVLDRVLESRQPYRGRVDVTAADHQFLNAFGGHPPSEIVVLPITNGDEIVGLLYGDNALNQRTIDDTVGLEVFLSQAGSVFQNAMMASQARSPLAMAL